MQFERKISEIKEAYFKVDGEKVEAETNVQEGENEFLITATMDEVSETFGVVKVTIFRDEIPLVSKMFASESGLTSISGPVVFDSQESSSSPHQH